MTSFRSRHYPKNRNKWVIFQEQAIRYYAVMILIVMIGVLLKIYLGESILWFTLGGVALSFILGNLLAYARLKRDIAEVFFLEKHFAVISVYDMLFEQQEHVFPLVYANPQRTSERITLHYKDQVIELKRDDWEDFDLIWNWLSNS